MTGEVGPRHITATVQLSGNDVLEVRLLGRKGSVLQIAIRPAGVGSPPAGWFGAPAPAAPMPLAHRVEPHMLVADSLGSVARF